MIAHDTDIRTVNGNENIVDCIQSGIYGDSPLSLIEFYESLPSQPIYDRLRILAVPYLFAAFERLVPSENDPIVQYSNILNELKLSVQELSVNSSFLKLHNTFEASIPEIYNDEIKLHTGQHYGNLFKEFSDASYFEEAKQLLQIRLERNEINLDLSKLNLLDQGCGGGRYTVAWKLLGAKSCTGIDYSEIGIEDATLRASAFKISDVSFILGSVNQMPFEDESFDLVFSNGVLHHTNNWKLGIQEQLRVMKKGGWGWQYLIENPGGIFWDNIEILRAILKNVNKKFAQQTLQSLAIPANRIFYMLDHVMVPINTRLTSEELVKELELNGAKEIRRLKRGADFDRVEKIYQKTPYAFEKYGVGEHRFVFTK